MADKETALKLTDLAFEFRLKLMRLCYESGDSVHIGGDMSSAEIMLALYHYKMNVDPTDISLPTRDRFVLSKGHGAAGMYVAMAMRGFFDFEEIVRTYGKTDSAFGMHPCKVHLPGVETSAGSLGHGLPVSVGLALAAVSRKETHRVFCLMGDGETCEGTVWEAAQTAASYELGNLVGIVDRNRQFMCTFSEDDEVVLEPYVDKWAAFGWRVIEVNDGNDMGQLIDAFDSLPHPGNNKPTVIIANTIKGKGISYMERQLGWHGNYVNKENYETAVADIEAAKAAWMERR
jgi:transketolase